MVTERDFAILLALVRYYVLNRSQIQRLIFPNDSSGRITRRRLQLLVDEHFINRQNVLIAHNNEQAAPVYFPARRGCEVLAELYDDERYLLAPTQAPVPHHTLHWLAVADTHIAFDAAMQNAEVSIEEWLNEWDICNKDETTPEKRYRLYTLIREQPRLVCAPDAAFLLEVKGFSKVFYLEQDRSTSGVRQIANGKTPGYAAMIERQLHRRHFPQTNVDEFSVLMVAPSAKRRDALRKAIQQKPGASVWRFVDVHDLTPDRLLQAPIYFTCESDEPKPLLKRQAKETGA